jgi:hypothetical protein
MTISQEQYRQEEDRENQRAGSPNSSHCSPFRKMRLNPQ